MRLGSREAGCCASPASTSSAVPFVNGASCARSEVIQLVVTGLARPQARSPADDQSVTNAVITGGTRSGEVPVYGRNGLSQPARFSGTIGVMALVAMPIVAGGCLVKPLPGHGGSSSF